MFGLGSERLSSVGTSIENSEAKIYSKNKNLDTYCIIKTEQMPAYNQHRADNTGFYPIELICKELACLASVHAHAYINSDLHT